LRGLAVLVGALALVVTGRRPPHRARQAAVAWPELTPIRLPPVSTPALAVGAFALGALAVGALAIGALAIGRLEIRKARLGEVEIDELTVRRFRVLETPEPGGQRRLNSSQGDRGPAMTRR
jgi:hypothetical protein